MPLIELQGHLVLRCINRHWREEDDGPKPKDPADPSRSWEPPKTTMVAEPGWLAIPIAPQAPTGARLTYMHSHQRALPVQVCVCSVCGYVEMYAGPVIAPKDWPTNVG